MSRDVAETTLDGIRDIKLYQNKNGYRFSVDALLLSSFVNVKRAGNIVDMGAGSGIIGLLLATRYPDSAVILIEIQQALSRLARKNVGLNGMDERVKVISMDIKDVPAFMEATSCEVAVSNPPFRKRNSGRLSLEEERSVARHEIKLQLPVLAQSASYLLKARGRFFVIYHPERILELMDILRRNRLEPKRMRFVYNDTRSPSKIVMVEAAKEGRPGLKIEKPLFIYDDRGIYTDEVKQMYGPGAS